MKKLMKSCDVSLRSMRSRVYIYIRGFLSSGIFLAESRLTRLVCTSLGYHACALDSWKLPLMWPCSGGPAVEARRSTCAQHVIISASTPFATPSHRGTDAQRYPGLSWRWDSSVLVKPVLLYGCWNMLKSDLHYWEGQGGGSGSLISLSKWASQTIPARVNYYPVRVCVWSHQFVYIRILFIFMSTKNRLFSGLPFKNLLLSVIYCLLFEFKHLQCDLLCPASCTDRAIHAFPNKTCRSPGPEIFSSEL